MNAFIPEQIYLFLIEKKIKELIIQKYIILEEKCGFLF